MKLIAFNYGMTDINGKMAFPDGDESVKIPIGLLFFLIEAEGRRILVDVGCDTMPGFQLHQFEYPVKVLESYGISRDEITDVIITHSHHDHIDSVYNYSNATIYIHKNELEGARRYLTDTQKTVVFEDGLKLLHNVEIKCIGGHTSGSCIVLLKTDEKTYVLCGDECYTKENLVKKIPTGSSQQIERSRYFVEEYSKEKYIPILFHSPSIVGEIGYRVLI